MRAKLAWLPCWEGPTREWTLGFLKKNKWRCDRIHEDEDLLQDAYLTFLKIEAKYPRVNSQAHFMTLYRSALRNQMHDHARYMQRKRDQHLDTAIDASELPGRIGELTNQGYLSLLLATAPLEVQQALLCIAQNPPDLNHETGHRENLNMKLRRVLGYDNSVDLMGGIRNLLEA